MPGQGWIAAGLAALTLAGCMPGGDETVSGFADPQAVYAVQEIDGRSVSGQATITFPEPGRVAGAAPCNSWSARQTAPYPWFELDGIMATKRACPELAEETAFFDALADMELAEVQGPVLILSASGGRQMVFRAEGQGPRR